MAKKIKTTKSETEDEVKKILGNKKENILGFKFNVKCKTPKQKDFYKSIMSNEITIVTGPAGTGKSYIGLTAALELLKDPDTPYKKIILIYPVEVDKSEEIGFLKGTLQEKLLPYQEADFYTMEKIFDSSGKIGKEIVQKLWETGLIEIKSASFLRGATIDNSIVIISESQNFSKDTLLKVLSRIGTNSKYIFNGDEQQLDACSLKSGKNVKGLRYAIDKLNGMTGVGITEFGINDILRNDIIIQILKRWIPEIYGDLPDSPLQQSLSD